MNIIARRVAAGFALVAAPALIALGAAGVSNAQTTVSNPTAGSHQVFPGQQNLPQPGTSVHHHHQHNR